MTSVRLRALRILRVLRPLKTINSNASKEASALSLLGLRKQVKALVQSVPDFMNVGAFLVFMMLLFAIFGMEEYSGTGYNRCRLTQMPDSDGYWPVDPTNTRLCSVSGYGTY